MTRTDDCRLNMDTHPDLSGTSSVGRAGLHVLHEGSRRHVHTQLCGWSDQPAFSTRAVAAI